MSSSGLTLIDFNLVRKSEDLFCIRGESCAATKSKGNDSKQSCAAHPTAHKISIKGAFCRPQNTFQIAYYCPNRRIMKFFSFIILTLSSALLWHGAYADVSDKNGVDKADNVRSLRFSPMAANKAATPPRGGEAKKLKHKVYERVLLEEVQVSLVGPDDYSSPGSEEVSYLIECLASSFDVVESDSGYEAGFAALEFIEEDRRRLNVESTAGHYLAKTEDERELWMSACK
jgi:hypothetical protein